MSNHASWFDIPLVAQILLSQNFKFIAADELRGLPLVGQQLVDGKHVFPSLASSLPAGADHEYAKGDESDSASDDGMEAFDQHRFDLDD